MIYESPAIAKEKRIKNNVSVLEKEIKGFINCIVIQLLKFYKFAMKQRDIKKDLFENMISNAILKDEIYMILFSLYSELHEVKISKIREI